MPSRVVCSPIAYDSNIELLLLRVRHALPALDRDLSNLFRSCKSDRLTNLRFKGAQVDCLYISSQCLTLCCLSWSARWCQVLRVGISESVNSDTWHLVPAICKRRHTYQRRGSIQVMSLRIPYLAQLPRSRRSFCLHSGFFVSLTLSWLLYVA